MDGGTWNCHQLRAQVGPASPGLGSAPFSVSVGDKDTGIGHPWHGEGDTRLCTGITPGGVFWDSLETWDHPALMRPSEGRNSWGRTIPAQIRDGKRMIGAALGEGLGASWMGSSKCPRQIPVPWADPAEWAAGKVGILPR